MEKEIKSSDLFESTKSTVPQSVMDLLNLSIEIQKKNGTYQYCLWEMLKDAEEVRDRIFHIDNDRRR